MGQPYGVDIFDTYIHERGGIMPCFQCITPMLDEGQGSQHGIGLGALFTYHQNLYNFINGFFFQTHLPASVGFYNSGADIDFVAGYHCIHTPRIISTFHIDAILSNNYFNLKSPPYDIANKKMGFGLCSLIKLCGKKRHNLSFFNDMRYHFQCATRQTNGWITINQGTGNLVDVILGLVYQYRAFFIDGGFDYHINYSKRSITTNTQSVISSSRTLNLYLDLGYKAEKIFKHKLGASFCCLGCAFNGFEGSIAITFKTGIAF